MTTNWDESDERPLVGPFRGGQVHVLVDKCPTCIFRPGNLMRLAPGRVKGMVDEAVANESAITCHATLYRDDVAPAVCRGFYDAHPTNPLRVARRLTALGMPMLVEDPVPPKET